MLALVRPPLIFCRLHYVFSKIDVGRQGSIEAKELKAVLERLGCPSRKKLRSDKELVMEASEHSACAEDMIWEIDEDGTSWEDFPCV